MRHFKDVKYIYRDYPIISDESLDLAMAGRCMGEQGLFWETHNYFFENQGLKTQEEIMLASKKLGADTLKFATCMESQKYLKQIKIDAKTAESLGFGGTPAFVMNGYALPQGELPMEYLEKLYNELTTKNIQ
ncbi:MAG: thioredoxin domain-containing protein [bacterium]